MFNEVKNSDDTMSLHYNTVTKNKGDIGVMYIQVQIWCILKNNYFFTPMDQDLLIFYSKLLIMGIFILTFPKMDLSRSIR